MSLRVKILMSLFSVASVCGLCCAAANVNESLLIKNINRDNTVYIIYAERNDSTFRIVTPIKESLDNHSGLEKLKKGKRFNLEIESFKDWAEKHDPFWPTNYMHFSFNFWGSNIPFNDHSDHPDIYTCSYLDGLWVTRDPVRPTTIKEYKPAKERVEKTVRQDSCSVDGELQHQTVITLTNKSDRLIWLMIERDQRLSNDDVFVSRFMTVDSSGQNLLKKILDHEVEKGSLNDPFSNLFKIIKPGEKFTIRVTGEITPVELDLLEKSLRLNFPQDFMKHARIMGGIQVFNPPAYQSDTLTIAAPQMCEEDPDDKI